MMHVEDTLANQQQLLGAIDNLFTNFKKDSSDRKTPDYIRRKLETLDKYWQEFQANHSKLSKIEYAKTHPYFSTNQYEIVQEKYENIRAAIQSYQSKEERIPTPIQKSANPLGIQHTSHEQPISFKSNQGTLSKTDSMLKKQSSNFKAFEHTISNLNLELKSQKWELDHILRVVQSRWSNIDSLHWELDSELDEGNQEYQQTYFNYEQTYNNIVAVINKKLYSVSHRELSTPQMDIPTFSGNYQQWSSFKDLFSEAIHNNASLSGAQKMQFLKSKLKGEAERLIQHLQITSENYTTGWNILNNRYNNEKLIFNSHVDILFSIPVAQHGSLHHIKNLHDTTIESLNAIKNLGVDISFWDPLLVHLLSQKLDIETFNEYAASIKEPRALPKLQDFLSFLESKFTTMEFSRQQYDNHSYKLSSNIKQSSLGRKQYKQNYNNMKQPFTMQGQYVAQSTNKNYDPLKYKCPICNQGEHGIYYCQRFLEMTPQVKRNTLRKLNICQNCLYNHNGNGCISSKRCRKCNDNHNTLLHEAFVRVSHNTPDVDSARNSTANQPSRRLTKTESSQLARGNSHVSFQNNIPEVLLPTAIIKVQAADGSFQTLRALLDQGSQTSIISENAAQLLGLPRKRCPGVICGIGQKDSNCKGEINIKCQAISSNYEFYTDVLIMNKLIRNLPNHTFSKPSWSYLDSITLADPNFNISRPVDILLGSSIYSKVLLEGLCRAEEYSASAQNTRLGWILSGDVTHSYQCNVVLHNLEEIQKFWEIEDITEESPFSSGDQQCIDYYKSTTTRLEDGRYQVRLPLKNIFENVLGSSKPKAIAQFKSLERKFTQNPDIEREYKRFMTEYQELGHMTLARKNYNPECFLTHHSVQNVESSSSKFRVVFNASAKTSSGYSLNDIMETGPNLQQDLQSLIIKWRLYKYAFTADIEKMFRQILIHEQDQQLQKIIWRNSPQDPLCEYQLATVTYGTKAAPFLAMMTLRQLAEDECSKYPDSQAGKVIEEQFYMDDLLSGSHDLQSAKQLQSDLIQLLKSAGMNLRKWSSNYSELLINVDSEKQTNEVFNFKYQESTKTLGLNWKPKTDQFTFLPILCTSTKKQTKRTLLSEISKLFDPLGWLTPISTKIKILFQKVWLANLQWDDQLPTDLNNEWNIIKTDLVNIKLFQIPRWLHCNKHDTLELHGFCDASMKAYACVIYCKIIRTDKYGHASISITMVAAKSRIVPPNKTITLPRLELSAAHLLAKLMKKVNSCLSEHNVVLYGWSDSTAVLGWLQGDTDRWKLFVANRVKEIVKTLPPNSWRYVKSNENPADCASRGLSAELLLHQSSWWNGPKWLPTFKKSTIENQHVYITSEDIKKSKQINVTTYPYKDILSDLINKHSSFTRVTRVLAWILRVKYRSKQSFLSVDELRRTKMYIIKHIQSIEFKKEVERLQNKKDLHVKSKILNLNPFLDSEGMLRVGGRLKFAHIDKNKIHPLIIPHDCHLTDLLIDHAHKMVFHGGPRITLAWLRQHYWIIGGNRAVKKRLRQCIRCRKCSPTYQNQVMGNLPESRVNPTRPFFKTGVDFTGYVEVKASKGRTIRSTKGYIAVFVCMATKAIHLELVSDLSSSSFLAALRRMAARRGTPRHLYSDNGTNFVGANNVLQHEIIELKNIINEEFLSHVSEMEIEWHFNSPSWPSAGGLWEAAVKSLKYHLRRVIGEQKLTFEEYATVLAQLEACLNSRPLCALTEDPEDIDYLTPSHFLSSGPTLTIIETERDKRTRWQLTQKIFQDTWKRWQTEYLCQLTARSKWLKAQPNLNINDIVIIHDANLPAGKWPMGRILEIHPGKDGYVRVVTVKTKNGVIKRPITKLSILPVHHNKSDKDVPASKSCTETS